jgi:hypothetical protein
VIRLVLAVVLAVAMLAAATTALEDARRSRGQTLADGAASRIVGAAEDLVRSESSVATWPDAARRVVEVTVPAGGLTETGTSYVAVGGVPGRGSPADTDRTDVVAYRLVGGEPRVHTLPVDVRVPSDRSSGKTDRVQLAPDDEPLVLRSSSTVRLGLLERAGRPVVLARRR